MSYTARVFYVLESDVTYILKYETPGKDVNIGDSFSLSFLDFDYNRTHYYVKYAINNGSVYKRGVNTIDCKSMMISNDKAYMNWFVFCTDDESEITGDCNVTYNDIAGELYLTISGSELSTKGTEKLLSISMSQGCVSDSFASYGSTYSPTMSCEMYAEDNDFTDALIAKTYYDSTVKGTLVNALMIIKGHEYNPIPFGRFVVKENPTYNGDTVSFTGNGLMSEYMDRAEIVISSLNKYHKAELESKYVKTGELEFIYTRDDLYFWEYLPQDFLRVTGCPLYIDNWKEILSAMKTYNLFQLMIPMVSNASYDDENGYDVSYETRITWRDLLSGIAVILRANVIEKNGAFYIKQLPELQTGSLYTYKPVFDGNSYDSSAIFGNNLMCPNNISVKANNWYFYKPNNEVIGFGYYDGDSTVVINDKASELSVENYPVTIESPWILYELLDRHDLGNKNCYPWFGFTGSRYWRDGLQFLNKAFVYHKASVETMYWHPLMSVGEMLTFEDYDGVKKYVLVGEMTLHYDGGFYAEITSPCEVQESNTSSVGSSGSNSYNSGSMAQSSGSSMGTQFGFLIKDGAITGAKIKDSTITNSKFENGTITGSKIADSTLTGAHIVDATIDFEKVTKSFIEDLTVDNAFIESATIKNLRGDNATLKKILVGELTADDILTKMLNADVALIGDGTISSLMTIRQTADKATILNLLTSKINVTSESGNMLIKDNTISIKDEHETPRVQIGKDASDDYNMYVWDSAGNLMFDAKGLTDKGIQRSIIRDDMVADNAAIKGSKIDIQTLVSSINESNYQLNSSNISYDGQTLESKFQRIDEQLNGAIYQNGIYSAIVNLDRTKKQDGSVAVILSCHVYKTTNGNQEEITDTYLDSDFLWSRMSDDMDSDDVWNERQLTGKTLRLTQDDVNIGCVFTCTIVAEKDKYIGTENKKAVSWNGLILKAGK